MRQQEDLIKGNSTSIFSLTSNAHELEHHQASQNVIIMNILLQQKKQIQAFEEECASLRFTVSELNKGSSSTVSNHPSMGSFPMQREEETVNQPCDDIEVDRQEADPPDQV